ncbi:MAG: nucleoside/nucleotide kinase family protein [Pseudonocardiales bacterium]|nr:MAG: nucleoside/nucleotide kinase family protein [Pseudonocardiales bacterium]
MLPRLADLVQRAVSLGNSGGRRLLGITGAPGAGKSTLAAELAAALSAPVVPMDGFHLDNTELRRLGRLERKGAPDTFDAEGYVALLRELRTGATVRAPAFERKREETVAEAIEVPADATLVITEGNYLLLDEAPWRAVRGLLDEVWYLDHPERVERLIARHIGHGWDPAVARARATGGSDGDNARLIIASRRRADLALGHGWLAG